MNHAGTALCVYSKAIIEEGFRCPPERPYAYEMGTFLVCSPNAERPDGLTDQMLESPPDPDVPEVGSSAPSPGQCELQLMIELGADPEFVQGAEALQGEAPLTFSALAINTTDRTIHMTLNERCLEGLADWSGLPASHDYYLTCPIPGTTTSCNPQQTIISLAPGEVRDLSAYMAIYPDGDRCNSPLPSGSYPLSFSLDFDSVDAQVCGPTPWIVDIP
ncbi:MAG: hypothetical protein AAFX99_06705 [Myxococcota bacterium]